MGDNICRGDRTARRGVRRGPQTSAERRASGQCHACMGLRPEALLGVWQMNMGITFGASTLGRTREEMLATSVSALNRCHY